MASGEMHKRYGWSDVYFVKRCDEEEVEYGMITKLGIRMAADRALNKHARMDSGGPAEWKWMMK